MKRIGGDISGGIYIPKPGSKFKPLFDIPVAEEAYSYTHGQLYSGSVWLDGRENFEKMKAALVGRYGEPSFVSKPMTTFRWKWPKEQIEVLLYYQTKFSRTTVRFSNDRI
jgi:hypothetical protein